MYYEAARFHVSLVRLDATFATRDSVRQRGQALAAELSAALQVHVAALAPVRMSSVEARVGTVSASYELHA